MTAVVDLGIQPDSAGRSDEVLAYGQIVCTLTARPDIYSVSFQYDDEPVDVPRGDASLGRQPLTATDRSLLSPGRCFVSVRPKPSHPERRQVHLRSGHRC